MIFLQFVLVATLVIIVSIKVADKAEWFEENTPIKGIIVGILLAASTSLPELVSGTTAVFINQPDMAASSILGSNLFNFLIIASAALMYIKNKPNHYVEKETNKINLFLILIYGVIIFDNVYKLQTGKNINFITERFSITTILIFVIYVSAMTYFNQGKEEINNTKVLAKKDAVLKQLFITMILVTILVFFSIQLAKVADGIVKVTGMSPSSVGAVLVGASTSLPEFVSAFALVKNKKYNMAFAATLGSNLFNFLILGILDLVCKTNITTEFSASTIVLIFFGLCNALLYYFFIKTKSDRLIVLASPFIASIVLYLVYLNVYFLK